KECVKGLEWNNQANPSGALYPCGRAHPFFLMLLVLTPAELEEPEVEHLTWLCQSHEMLATLYALVQRFRRMLRERQGESLDGWIADCQASGISELTQFAMGLLREREWVVAGITHSASNGPTEGANTKLKLAKRAM